MANVLPFERQVRVVSCLVEGNSIRSTERLLDVHRDTVMKLGVRVGEACTALHDRLVRDLHVSFLELDEIWAFVGKKQKRLQEGDDQAEFGDQYAFVGLDANRKLIVSYRVGKRDGTTAYAFCSDLRSRVLGRSQITTDGFSPYLDAIGFTFGTHADYAMVIKEYAGDGRKDSAHRYSPGRVIGVEKRVISGHPVLERASTSYVERQNLPIRMQMRRFTRLTNAFSKKLRNHQAAFALHVAYYNFCRVHETLRVTPAMESRITDHIWSVAELLTRAEEAEAEGPSRPMPPGPRIPHRPASSLGPGRSGLRLIQGGRA